MALVTFGNKTQATGAQLDQNFTDLGALTPIPCTVGGTNTITLTPFTTDTPSVPSYQNYRQFTAVAAATNTGAATGKVGSLATLSIYKPSPSGPVSLVGGEIVAGVAFTLLYDSALNTGAGGFHLMESGAVTFAGGSISGPIVGTGSLATITYPVAVFPLITGNTLASVGRLSINGGPTISRILYTTASVSFAAMLPQTGSTANINLAGASVGDIVNISFFSAPSIGVKFSGYVPGTGSITLQAFNGTSGTVTPGGATYGAQAIGYS